MKKALVVGIDDYPSSPLNGCVNDAVSVANILEKNSDGSPNFSVRLLTSNETNVSSENLSNALEELFRGDAETIIFFFAGHGIINQETNAGIIVSQDGKKGSWGVSLSDILTMANNAYPRVRSTVIVLDSCHSGFAGEVQTLGNNISVIGNGVTILTACHREGTASESHGHGLFTGLFLDGLSGSAADICGRITPASVYAHIDQTLGPWEQRPIYKTNVQSFVTLRDVTPKVPLEILRHLPIYFPDAAYKFPLNPSFESDRENIPENLRDIAVDETNMRILKNYRPVIDMG